MTKSSLDGNTPAEARRKIAAFFGDPGNRTASALERLPPETFLRTPGVEKIRSGAARHLHVYRIGPGDECSLESVRMFEGSPEITDGAFLVTDNDRIRSKDGCYYVKMGTALLRYIRENSQDTGAERAADAVDAVPIPRMVDTVDTLPIPRAPAPQYTGPPPQVAAGNAIDQRATEALGVALQILSDVDSDPRVVPVVRVINTVLRTGLDHVRTDNLL
jgi:hypothetical protein